MPLPPPVISGAVIAAGVPTGLVGPSFFRLAGAVGVGTAGWFATTFGATVMTGVSAGVAGVGSVNGKVIVPPNPGIVIGTLAGVGLVGPSAIKLGIAVGMGVPMAISAAGLYTGVSAGVGFGGSVDKVVFANAASLIPMLSASMAAVGMVGPSAQKLAIGLGGGISLLVMTGLGIGVVTGPVAPSPGMGVTTSFIY